MLAKRFLDGGVVLSSVGQGPANRVFTAPGPAAIAEPVAVLIDGRTASAAEAFAAALGDPGRATLVGMPSYGKASVQQDVPLADGGILRVTIARLRSPRGGDYHGRGIVPHVVETDPSRQLTVAEDRLRAGR
jgi:carboxyl-terminal processing protease